MDELFSSTELRAVLRFSLKATVVSRLTDFGTTTADGPEFNPDNPGLRPLIEQILFSRRFILTYYAVTGAIIAIATACHLGNRLSRSRRRPRLPQGDLDKRREGEGGQTHPSIQSDDASSSSIVTSSSSTLQGTQSPPDQTSAKPPIDERTSLLSTKDEAPKPSQRIYHRLQAFLMYQPAPIPAITSTSNVLPDNGTTLLILLFLGLNVFYLFHHMPLSIPMLFAFADRAGLCFVANLPILYILSAKNNQPIKWLTGWSYEGLNIFHRRLGEWMVILAMLHTIGMFGVWYTLLRPLHFTLLRFLSSKVILLGIFTFLSYIVIWATSTGIVRQFFYEYFLGLHISVQLAALVLLFFHHSGSKPYVLAALVIWAVDRVVLRMVVSRVQVPADLTITPDGETVLLFCSISIRNKTLSSFYLQRNIHQGWQPGQHVFVTVPALGIQHQLQTHPFTIASPAPPSRCTGTWPLQLTIRAKDGFSKDLLNFAKSQIDPGTTVPIILDGPYGSNNTLSSLRHCDRQCLIAGGSGIAVTYPYAWTLNVHNEPQALVLRDVEEALVTTQRTIPPYTISLINADGFRHIWVRSEWNHSSWLRFWPKYGSMRIKGGCIQTSSEISVNEDGTAIGNLLSYVKPTRDSGKGRPDLAWELREWVGGKKFREEESICVVVSGPDGMVRDVRNACAELVKEGWRIEVHVEKFGW